MSIPEGPRVSVWTCSLEVTPSSLFLSPLIITLFAKETQMSQRHKEKDKLTRAYKCCRRIQNALFFSFRCREFLIPKADGLEYHRTGRKKIGEKK